MWKAYLGVLLFGGAHLWGILLPAQRDRLKAGMGEGVYKGAYSVATLAGLVLLVMAYLGARSGPASLDMFYEPWLGAVHLYALMVWMAFVLIGASGGKGYIKAWVRHPMSLGFALWSAAHLMANGEKALVWLFGSIFAVAVADLVFSFARGKRPLHQPVISSDLKAIVIGSVLFLIFLLGFHPYVLNVPVV